MQARGIAPRFNHCARFVFHTPTPTHPHKRLAHPRSPIALLSTLTSRATHAHPTSPRSTGFCAIWDCISSSSSSSSLAPSTKPTTLACCSGSAGPHVVPRSHHGLGCSVASLRAASSTSAGLSSSCPSSLVLAAALAPPPLPSPPMPPPRCPCPRRTMLLRKVPPPLAHAWLLAEFLPKTEWTRLLDYSGNRTATHQPLTCWM